MVGTTLGLAAPLLGQNAHAEQNVVAEQKAEGAVKAELQQSWIGESLKRFLHERRADECDRCAFAFNTARARAKYLINVP